MMPEETALAATEMKAKVLMLTHRAKFSPAMHPWKEPVERVPAKAKELGLTMLTPRIGRIINGPDLKLSVRWWDEVK